MDAQPILTRPSEVRALLAQLDFRPARILGQNFLIDRNILNILLREADVQPDDAVLEVGPGLGVLTAALLDTVKTVTAVEKDKRLAAYLRERFADAPSLRLIQADILDCDLAALLAAPETKLVANLPYAIAARLLPVFERLMRGWHAQGYRLVSTRRLFESFDAARLPRHEVATGEVPGRSGTLALQGAVLP